jgi:hypothetical protein
MFAMALSLLAACGGDPLMSPDAGDGGTTDAAGTTGTAGTGAGGSAGAHQLPSCFLNLFAACPTEGACQRDNATGNSCYPSGVKVAAKRGSLLCGTAAPNSDVFQDVFKPDGTLCYTTQYSLLRGCESGEMTWRNASGDVVATRSSGPGEPGTSHYTFACPDSGETLSFTCPAFVPGGCSTTPDSQPGGDCTSGGSCP